MASMNGLDWHKEWHLAPAGRRFGQAIAISLTDSGGHVAGWLLQKPLRRGSIVQVHQDRSETALETQAHLLLVNSRR